MNSVSYQATLSDIMDKIKSAQTRAVRAVNRELIVLYWSIGTVINEHSVWGNKFIENLARDIKLAFPSAKGYSVRNLKYMAKFASIYPDIEIVQSLSAQLSWSHHIALLNCVKDDKQRDW